jgi:hypothetical protein
MTKARQRERKKRLQRASAAERISAAANERETDEATVKIVDGLFLALAKKAAAEISISIEDAIEGSWSLFEAGFLRLVAGDDDRVGIEPCRENRAEQYAPQRLRPGDREARRVLAADRCDRGHGWGVRDDGQEHPAAGSVARVDHGRCAPSAWSEEPDEPRLCAERRVEGMDRDAAPMDRGQIRASHADRYRQTDAPSRREVISRQQKGTWR